MQPPEQAGRRALPAATITRLPRQVTLILLAADVAGILLFFNIAFWLRLDYVPWFTAGMLLPIGLLLLSQHVLDTYSIETQVSGMRPPARSMLGVVLAGLLNGAAAYAAALWGEDPTFGRGIFVLAFLAQAAWSPLWRAALWAWAHDRSQSARWLVLGTGEQALRLRMDFERVRAGGEVVLAPDVGAQLEQLSAAEWSGVIVALEQPASESLIQQLMVLRFSGIRVYDFADFYEQFWFKVPVLHTSHGWLVFSHGFDLLHNPLGLRLKRMLDVFFAGVLLVLALPLMLAVAVLIRLESRGPALFRQVRTGLNGSEFELFKFRSMGLGAEQDGPRWAEAKDPRVTRIGRAIRALRIDELPQLINVLKGEMSFIGPRPERPVFNATLEREIPFYNLRHLVRPGITGWAQVMYPYGASAEDALEKLQYDLYYIKNYSVLLDVGILFKTIRVILRGKGR